MLATNNDLMWTIGERYYSESSVGFLKRFQNSLCLFSKSIGQLYSNYEIYPLRSTPNRLVALPNPNAYHDIFFNIDQDAVTPTGIYIVQTQADVNSSSNGLHMVYKSSKTGGYRAVPLKKGLEIVRKAYAKKGDFLPVIINKDLQFKENQKPVMHLHRLDLSKLKKASSMQRRNISLAIEGKLESLVNEPMAA
jgi:hypothetical protein